MHFVSQGIETSDCGPACIAMLAGWKSIEPARAVLNRTAEGYARVEQMRSCLKGLGFNVSGLLNSRGTRCEDLRENDENLLLRTKSDEGGYFHWMIWNGLEKRVYGPEKGIRNCPGPGLSLEGYYLVERP